MGSRIQTVETWRDGELLDSRTVTIVTTLQQDNEESLTAEATRLIVALREIAGTSGTLTTGILSNAVRSLARALVVLLRLHLRQFDATG